MSLEYPAYLVVITVAELDLGHTTKRCGRTQNTYVRCACEWESSCLSDVTPNEQFAQHRVDMWAADQVVLGSLTQRGAEVAALLVHSFTGEYPELIETARAVAL